MNRDLLIFLQGISSTAAWISGLFFLKFWRNSLDTLFAFFSAAFAFLGLSWALLAIVAPTQETRPYYSLRLIAFGLIIAGIVAKNRRTI